MFIDNLQYRGGPARLVFEADPLSSIIGRIMFSPERIRVLRWRTEVPNATRCDSVTVAEAKAILEANGRPIPEDLLEVLT